MSTPTYDSFFDDLARVAPELAPVRAQHEAEYGDLLHHVLMGELTGHLLEAHRRARGGDATAEHLLRRCLDFLEEAMEADDSRVSELVTVSFLENLHQAGGDLDDLRARLGPRLAAQLRRTEADWSAP